MEHLTRQSKLELYTALSLRKKAEEASLVFTKADKGNSVVAISNTQYISKTLDFLKDEQIQEIPSDPTLIYQKLTKSVIKDTTFFTEFEKRRLVIMNPQAPKLYSLIKLHKENYPIRPVVSFVSAPSTKLSKTLINIILQFCKFRPKYSIKNSYELVKNIKHLTIPRNAKLISFDVKNLFPSVPPNEVLNLVEELLIKNKVY